MGFSSLFMSPSARCHTDDVIKIHSEIVCTHQNNRISVSFYATEACEKYETEMAET